MRLPKFGVHYFLLILLVSSSPYPLNNGINWPLVGEVLNPHKLLTLEGVKLPVQHQKLTFAR
jgi:hypothetical protein